MKLNKDKIKPFYKRAISGHQRAYEHYSKYCVNGDIAYLENAALELQRSWEYLLKSLATIYNVEYGKTHRIDSIMYGLDQQSDFFFTDYDRCVKSASNVAKWKS